MPPFLDTTDVSIAELTPTGRSLLARSALGLTTFKLDSFSVGRGGYDPTNPVKTTPLVHFSDLATQTLQISNNSFDAGDLVKINDVEFEVDPTGTGIKDWDQGATSADSAQNLINAILGSTDPRVRNKVGVKSLVGDTITFESLYSGYIGNLNRVEVIDGATPNFTLGAGAPYMINGANEHLEDQIFPLPGEDSIIHILRNDFEAGDKVFINGVQFAVDPNAVGAFDWDAGINGEAHSGINPSEDITASVNARFQIKVDGDVGGFQEVVLDQTGKNTGTLIASELQSKIQALGGLYAGVTALWVGAENRYRIRSGSLGLTSSVEIRGNWYEFSVPASGPYTINVPWINIDLSAIFVYNKTENKFLNQSAVAPAWNEYQVSDVAAGIITFNENNDGDDIRVYYQDIVQELRLSLEYEAIFRTGLTNVEESADNLITAINGSTNPSMSGVSAVWGGHGRVKLSGNITGLVTDSDNLIDNFGLTGEHTKNILQYERPNFHTVAAVCRLERNEANYGLGEVGIWAKILGSNVGGEVDTLVLFATAHFPIQAKNLKSVQAHRVIVTF